MDTAKSVGVGIVLVVVVAGALGYAYVEGIGPLKEDPAAGLEDPPETEKAYDMSGGGEESVDTGGEDKDTPPFAFEVESIEKCGRTCREVNAALHNRMEQDAEDIVVHTWIYAGNSTAREDVVWADNRDISVLESGDVHRSTDRVELSIQQAENVREKDNWITVEAVVESQQETVKFVNREQV
jgi:hypothetical protein